MSLKLTSARPDWANRFAKKLKSADKGFWNTTENYRAVEN